MSTNAIFNALLALGTGITWGAGETFVETSRKLKMWDKAPQPSLYQVEGDDVVRTQDGQLTRNMLKANWVIYHRAGKDQAVIPAETSSDILDAVKTVLQPIVAGARVDLGGLVYRTYIDGKITKDNGDLDGQALLIVPITLIVP